MYPNISPLLFIHLSIQSAANLLLHLALERATSDTRRVSVAAPCMPPSSTAFIQLCKVGRHLHCRKSFWLILLPPAGMKIFGSGETQKASDSLKRQGHKVTNEII